ncbi:peptidylprolyl isomerase [Niveibacterium sp. SC-1]|uniref:peptidylprolyl isomerase n=1 Tax=Niveibacterium sp. SC-1 TaxID=3135646 RepID=UPI00311E575A
MKMMFKSVSCRFVAFLLALGVCTGTAQAARQPLDKIVAVINSEVITQNELAGRVDQFEAQLKRQKRPVPPRDVFERQMLERIIYEKVQLQYARETSLRVDDATLERAVERVAANNKLTVEQFRAALKKDDVDWTRFREELRNEMTLSRLREREVDSRTMVSDAEIDAYMSAAASDRSSGQEVSVAHILLRAPEGANAETWRRLQQKAEDILARARQGDDFSRLAAANSDAPDALNGGSLGWRTADRLPTLYADAIRMLQPGGLTPVLRSPAGLHIVKVIDLRGADNKGPQVVQKTHARHILIKTGELVSDAEARQRLEQVRERIAKGADFAEQAKRYSGDGSAPRGGDLGWMGPGDTVPDFEKAMDALKPGEISQPVQSPFGWHLIQVIERKSEDVSDERRRNEARQALVARKSDEAYDEFVRQLRDKAFVEVRPPYADDKGTVAGAQ